MLKDKRTAISLLEDEGGKDTNKKKSKLISWIQHNVSMGERTQAGRR